LWDAVVCLFASLIGCIWIVVGEGDVPLSDVALIFRCCFSLSNFGVSAVNQVDAKYRHFWVVWLQLIIPSQILENGP
jgi:hypothetical protein